MRRERSGKELSERGRREEIGTRESEGREKRERKKRDGGRNLSLFETGSRISTRYVMAVVVVGVRGESLSER